MKYVDFTQALKITLDGVESTNKTELISIFEATNRVLASDIICKKDLPAFNNSGMDGYVIRSIHQGKKVEVKKTIMAGDFVDFILDDSFCSKIMTGAMVPAGGEIVVPKEDVTIDGDFVTFPNNLKLGQNIKIRAEEAKNGEVLIKKNELLSPAYIGVCASQGISVVEVYKRLKVAIISSGDEIIEPWESAKEYQIYNSNSSALLSYLKKFGFEATYVRVNEDNIEAMKKCVKTLLDFDAIIATGGISVGEADYTKEVFDSFGMQTFFNGIKIKPGKPTTIGKINNTLIMALPGNPLSALINFYILSLPALLKKQGVDKHNHTFIYCKNKEQFKIKTSRVNVLLGSCDNGEFCVTNGGKYGSGMLTPLACSNAVVLLDKQSSIIEKDELLKVVLLEPILKSENQNYINY